MQWLYPDRQLTSNESVIDYLLEQRGISDKVQFLRPELQALHPWPELHDLPTAVKVIAAAVADHQKIYIHGDYDVDGVSATAILWDFLYREMGADVLPYIPSRFDQGYGLSESSVSEMVQAGAKLIITVDCGVKDLAIVEKYTKQGIGFVITDHHGLAQGDKGQPVVSEAALAVVHPRHPLSTYPFPEICGSTVAWKLVVALNDYLNKGVDVYHYLDLVALATVCDVMPLHDENRILVKYGLERLRRSENPGLNALLEVASVDKSTLDTYHFGYVLGPRLNAAGRMESALDAVRLLTTRSTEAARLHATKLHLLNQKRQEVTEQLMAEAEQMVASQLTNPLLFVYGPNWSEGIVGLVAGKLAERYARPVIVGTVLGDGTIKASARSVAGFHITQALQETEELLVRYGGHELAAGLTVAATNVTKLQQRLTDKVAAALAGKVLERELAIDLVLSPEQCNLALVAELSELAPFGFGNEQPVIALEQLEVLTRRNFGAKSEHLALKVRELPQGELITFGNADLYSDVAVGDQISVAGHLATRSWNGNTYLQLKLRDKKG